MNCPACLSIMTNRDEVHRISHTQYRMNLHCTNYTNCPARRKYDIYYGPYMQVITEDPKPWECRQYGLIIMKKSDRILLQGSAMDGTKISVMKGTDWVPVINIDFVKLSTDNDMHLQAIKLTNKLSKLLPFI
jgi:hypothetical protein